MGEYNISELEEQCWGHPTPFDYDGEEHCSPYWDGNICWPQTEAGLLRSLNCPTTGETISRLCTADSHWDFPDKSCPDYLTEEVYNHTIIDLSMWQIIGISLNILSFVFVFVALITWILIWVKFRRLSSYRYASFILMFASLFVLYCIWNVQEYIHYPQSERVSCVLGPLLHYVTDSLLVFSVLVYLINCVMVALRRKLSCARIAIGILVSLCLAVVLGVAQGVVLIGYEAVNGCFEALFRSHVNLVIMVPKLLALLITLVLDIAILAHCFLLNNDRYKGSRDYRLIRHSSVAVLALTLYGIVTAVFEFLRIEGIALGDHYNYWWAFYGIMVRSKGIFFGLLLCFLDLEVLSCCPCACIKLEDGFVGSLEFPPLTQSEEPVDEKQKDNMVATFEMELNGQGKAHYGAIIEPK